MKTNCKHFESRTLATGDAIRRCRLDLAPDAPWRCPEQCAKFEHRSVDIGWAHETISPTSTTLEPTSVADGSAAAVLSETEAIINAMAASMSTEVKSKKSKKPKKRKRK